MAVLTRSASASPPGGRRPETRLLPGDIILADDNGVLVLKPEQIAMLVERCEPLAQAEPEKRRRLRSGEPLAEMSGANRKIAATLEAQRNR